MLLLSFFCSAGDVEKRAHRIDGTRNERTASDWDDARLGRSRRHVDVDAIAREGWMLRTQKGGCAASKVALRIALSLDPSVRRSHLHHPVHLR